MNIDNLSDFFNAAMDGPHQKLRRDFPNVMEQTHERWLRASEELRAMFGTGYEVDEMALFFPTPDLLFEFINRAVRAGWVLFNQAEDMVETSPIPAIYTVQYWFLRSENHSYRLELMLVGDGFSPLHGALQDMCARYSHPCVSAHASFKVANEEQYAAAVLGLGNAGYALAQHCSSTYGRFSYYMHDGARTIPPLKPRLNLRDGGVNSGN